MTNRLALVLAAAGSIALGAEALAQSRGNTFFLVENLGPQRAISVAPGTQAFLNSFDAKNAGGEGGRVLSMDFTVGDPSVISQITLQLSAPQVDQTLSMPVNGQLTTFVFKPELRVGGKDSMNVRVSVTGAAPTAAVIGSSSSQFALAGVAGVLVLGLFVAAPGRRKRISGAAALGALVLLVAGSSGCGDDDNNNDGLSVVSVSAITFSGGGAAEQTPGLPVQLGGIAQ